MIGVDVGGTKILAGVIERDGSVGRRHERPTPLETADALMDALEAAVGELRDDSITAVGFGLPSRIDQRAGRIDGSVNIPLQGVDFRDPMEERLGLPIALENDGNAAALGEFHAGAGREAETMVMLTLGTGVGGGVVIDRRLLRDGGELGHVVIEYDGIPCQGTCTGRGHLEGYASGTAATKLAREAVGPDVDAHGLVRLAEERKWGGLTERLLVATASSYVVSPSALGPVAVDPNREVDRLSASYLIALGARVVREVGDLVRRAEEAGKRLATLAVDTEVRFRSATDRAAFTSELTEAITKLIAKYHDESAPGGRAHRLVVVAHPLPQKSEPREPL